MQLLGYQLNPSEEGPSITAPIKFSGHPKSCPGLTRMLSFK